MIRLSLCCLAIVHVLVVLYFINLISSGTLTILLYILIVLPELVILQQEYFPDLFDFEVLFDFEGDDFFLIKQTNKVSDVNPEELKAATRPNLYIQRWRKKFLNPAKKFPLDRLAFLSAKYYYCSEIAKFSIQNSHLKQLVSKDDYRPNVEFEDDAHPCKMVKESSVVYIHQRANAYRKRKAIIVDRKQISAHRTRREKKLTTSKIFQSLPLATDSDDSGRSKVPEVVESISTLSEIDSFDSEESINSLRKPSMWRRVSRAFRFNSFMPKKNSKEADDEED